MQHCCTIQLIDVIPVTKLDRAEKTKSFPYSTCLKVIQRWSSPFGVVVFFGMPNSESESEFTVSMTFFCLGALLALGAVSEGGLPIKQISFQLVNVIYLSTNQAEVSSVTVDFF